MTIFLLIIRIDLLYMYIATGLIRAIYQLFVIAFLCCVSPDYWLSSCYYIHSKKFWNGFFEITREGGKIIKWDLFHKLALKKKHLGTHGWVRWGWGVYLKTPKNMIFGARNFARFWSFLKTVLGMRKQSISEFFGSMGVGDWHKVGGDRAWLWRNNDVIVAEKVQKMAFFGIFQTVGAGWTRVLPGCNWHQIAGNLVGILILGIFGGVTWSLVPLLWTKLGTPIFLGDKNGFLPTTFDRVGILGWNQH